MKLRDILLVALLGVMGSLVFAIKQSQKSLETDSAIIPVPSVKPAPPKIAGLPELRLDLSTPETAGSYGRLSLDKFLAQGEAEYVYKDGCYKKAIAALPLGNMPSDDGVNLRVNMRF